MQVLDSRNLDKGMGVDFRDGITREDVIFEQDLYTKDQKRILKKYNSKKRPNFRLAAEYLRGKYVAGALELDKKQICKDLKMKMGTLNLYLSELNRFEKFQPMRWISVQGKKDFIEVAGFDFKNSHKWVKKNIKGSISRTARVYQTKEKVRLIEEQQAYESYIKRKTQKAEVKNGRRKDKAD